MDWISEADSSVCGPDPSGLEKAQRCPALAHAYRPAFLPICVGSNLDFVYVYILTTNKKQGVVVWVCIATKQIIAGLSTALTFR